MYKHFFKRFFDFWVALIGVLLSSPLLIVTAIWLHFANKGAGAFFLQERPGLHGKIFKIIKFKTMTDERDAEGNLLPDAQRLTKVGKLVRSFARVSRVGRSVMVVTTSAGLRNSNWTSGMWIMYP